MTVFEHDTILARCLQDLAHAMPNQFLEFGAHGAKASLSHERDNAFDTGGIFCTVYVQLVLEEISDTLALVGTKGVITSQIRAVSLCVESSEYAVICSHASVGGGTVLPVIESVSDIRVSSEDMIASACDTFETRRLVLVCRDVPRFWPMI